MNVEAVRRLLQGENGDHPKNARLTGDDATLTAPGRVALQFLDHG